MTQTYQLDLGPMQVKMALGSSSSGIIRQQMVTNGFRLLMPREHCCHMRRIMPRQKRKHYQLSLESNGFMSTFTDVILPSSMVISLLNPSLTNPITQCLPRIRRFFMKLQKYDFDLEYAAGKTMVVSDALSRACINSNSSPELDESDIIHHVHSVIDSLPTSTARLT